VQNIRFKGNELHFTRLLLSFVLLSDDKERELAAYNIKLICKLDNEGVIISIAQELIQ